MLTFYHIYYTLIVGGDKMSQLLQDLVNIVLLGEFVIKVYKFWKNHRGK